MSKRARCPAQLAGDEVGKAVDVRRGPIEGAGGEAGHAPRVESAHLRLDGPDCVRGLA